MKKITDLSVLARNILSVYFLADDATKLSAKGWYSDALVISEQFAERYNIPFLKVAGVIASVSPRKEWAQNVRLAEKILAQHNAGVSAVEGGGYLTVGLKKADKILALELTDNDDTNKAEIMLILNGNKIKAFFKNIIGEDGVTVDGHATNIVESGAVRLSISKAKELTDKKYQMYAAAYIEAGEFVGITGSEMQSVTWVAYKELVIK